MLSDRDYMRRPMEPDRRSFRLSGNQMLMIGLVAIFFVQVILDQITGVSIEEVFGLEPASVVDHFWFWQPFTYQFIQEPGNLFEFAFILLGLFFFGPVVESRWGWRKYFLLFLSAGVFAGFVYIPLGYLFRHTANPLLGSVSSVMAIMVMAAVSRPNMTVLLFFVFPMKLKHVIWLFVAIGAFSLLSNPVGAIHLAVPHLAGACFGVLYSFYHRSIDQFFSSLEPNEPGTTDSGRIDDSFRRQRESPYSDEVDDILDKIHQEGINSLTPEERELLEKASDELQGEDRYGSFN